MQIEQKVTSEREELTIWHAIAGNLMAVLERKIFNTHYFLTIQLSSEDFIQLLGISTFPLLLVTPMQKVWDDTLRLLALTEFTALTKVTFQRSEQTEKTKTKWIGGGPQEAISMLIAIVNSRKQPVEFTVSMNGILLHS